MLDVVETRFGIRPEPKQTVLVAKEAVAGVDSENPGAMFDASIDNSMVSVIVNNDGAFSQGYKLAIEVIAKMDEGEEPRFEGIRRAKSGFNLYILDIKVEAIDYQTEIENYERYVQEVYTKA